MSAKLFGYKISLITFREHGLSIKGSIYLWNSREKKVRYLSLDHVNEFRKMVRDSSTIVLEFYCKDRVLSLTGKFSSVNTRKSTSVVFYAPYKINFKDTIERLFETTVIKYIGTLKKFKPFLVFSLKKDITKSTEKRPGTK